jgi:hypothetical protein
MEEGGGVAEGKDSVPKFRTGSVILKIHNFTGLLQLTYWPTLSFISRLCVSVHKAAVS